MTPPDSPPRRCDSSDDFIAHEIGDVRLHEHLRTLFQPEIPGSLLNRLREQGEQMTFPIPANPNQRRETRSRPTTVPVKPRLALRQRPRHSVVARLGGLAAAVILALVVSAAVVVATVVDDWRDLFDQGFGTGSVSEQDMGVDINRSETVDGFTVTVGHAYADPYQLTLDASLTTPVDSSIDRAFIQRSAVYDAKGDALQNQPYAVGNDGGTLYQLYNTPLPPAATSGQYRLEVTAINVLDLDQPASDHSGEALGNYHCDAIAYTPVPGQTFGGDCTITLSEPITIPFEVPLAPGLSAQPGTLTSDGTGTQISVEQVALGQIGASVAIRGVGPYARVTIQAGDTTYRLSTIGMACPYDGSTLFTYVTDERIPLDQGPVVLRVNADPGQQPSTLGVSGELGSCQRLNVTGEWETVIPAAKS